MKELTHLSLFSGIGGLDLAAEWAGIRTVGQCEWAEYPTKVLEKHWTDVPRWKDIRTLTGEGFYERTGARTVDIISGGFPCQPFSVAGKRRGTEDDRYLWPEMVRVIKELRPSWVIGENVAGIVKMALPDILSELGACGYRTRAFLIPACAVGARHRRYRVAIVGCYADSPRLQAQRAEQQAAGAAGASEAMASAKSVHKGRLPGGKAAEKPGFVGGSKNVCYSDGAGCQKQHVPEITGMQGFVGGGCNEGNVCYPAGEGLADRAGQQMGGQGAQEQEPERSGRNVSDTHNGSRAVWRDGEFSAAQETGGIWRDIRDGAEKHEPRKRRTVESRLGGVADGLPGWVDGYWDTELDIPRIAKGIVNRVERLKALGNAVVPQQFYPIFEAIAEIESDSEN